MLIYLLSTVTTSRTISHIFPRSICEIAIHCWKGTTSNTYSEVGRENTQHNRHIPFGQLCCASVCVSGPSVSSVYPELSENDQVTHNTKSYAATINHRVIESVNFLFSVNIYDPTAFVLRIFFSITILRCILIHSIPWVCVRGKHSNYTIADHHDIQSKKKKITTTMATIQNNYALWIDRNWKRKQKNIKLDSRCSHIL